VLSGDFGAALPEEEAATAPGLSVELELASFLGAAVGSLLHDLSNADRKSQFPSLSLNFGFGSTSIGSAAEPDFGALAFSAASI
jgi:hypothetical protein